MGAFFMVRKRVSAGPVCRRLQDAKESACQLWAYIPSKKNFIFLSSVT